MYILVFEFVMRRGLIRMASRYPFCHLQFRLGPLSSLSHAFLGFDGLPIRGLEMIALRSNIALFPDQSHVIGMCSASTRIISSFEKHFHILKIQLVRLASVYLIRKCYLIHRSQEVRKSPKDPEII
jgi:hypothetical protein